MPVKKKLRPVKPLPADQVRPDGYWSPERFSERTARKAAELDAQVLERMRAELQPQLDREVAQIKAQAREEGHKEGYEAGLEAGRKAGFEAGYEAGMKEARELIEQLRTRAAALTLALQHPLDAWDEAITTAISNLIIESLRRFLVEDADARVRLMREQLKPLLQQMKGRDAPVTIVAHPDTVTLLRQHLALEDVQWEADEACGPDQVRVHQSVTEVVLDWQQVLDDYIRALEQALARRDEDASADTPPETTP